MKVVIPSLHNFEIWQRIIIRKINYSTLLQRIVNTQNIFKVYGFGWGWLYIWFNCIPKKALTKLWEDFSPLGIYWHYTLSYVTLVLFTFQRC